MSRTIVASLLFATCLWPAGAMAAGTANDYLLSQTPKVQATTLGKAIGLGCVGRTAFYMGMGAQKQTRNIAFWSVKCSNGNSYAVEVAPNGSQQSMQCSAFALNNIGQCFKKLPGS